MNMNKKFIITALLTLVAVAGQAQEFTPVVEDSIDFVITGTTPTDHDSVTWFLVAPYRQCLVPKIPLVDGRFTIRERLPQGTFFQIGDFIGNDLRFIVDDVPTDINLATGELNSGSELQRRFIEGQMRLREIENSIDPWWESLAQERSDSILEMHYGQITPVTAQDSADLERYDSASADFFACVRQIIRRNKDNIIPAYYIHTQYGGFNKLETDEFMREDTPYAHHPAMRRPWQQYWGEQRQREVVSKPFLDFEAEAPEGTKHHLSDYAGRGQYVLIDFWASWCGPCIASFPLMEQMHEVFGERGLRIIGVSIDQDKDSWLNAVDKYQLPWLQLRETIASQSNRTSASEKYGITGVPTLVLIAPDGTVISTDLDRKELKTKLEEIFEGK